MSDSLLSISNEKAAELDFSYAREEIRTRTEFSKRIQTLQYTAFGALLVSSQLQGHLVAISLIGLLLNYIFLHEIVKNATYVRLAALYIVKVVNQRYSPPICEWELFITIMRKESVGFRNKYFHYLESSLTTPIAAATICVLLFVHGFAWRHTSILTLSEIIVFALLLIINSYGVFAHVSNRRALWNCFSSEELAAFRQRYKIATN